MIRADGARNDVNYVDVGDRDWSQRLLAEQSRKHRDTEQTAEGLPEHDGESNTAITFSRDTSHVWRRRKLAQSFDVKPAIGSTDLPGMAEFPLDGLDQIDWARLRHAYGPATDVPAMLRELAGDGEASRAFDQLFSSLNHQGSVYSATSAAIPFLLHILEDGRRSELVHFLGSVAEAKNASIGLELGKGMRALCRLLASEDPEKRASAARALSAVIDHTGEAIKALRRSIKHERDQNTRAAMTESLATLDEKFAPARGASTREQFRAARAMARRERADISDKTLSQIAANWRPALEDEASDAGEMIVLGRGFPRAKQLQFYAALLGETTVPLEAVTLARELLVVAFDDRRAWGGRGFYRQSLYCEFMKVRGKAPSWGKPLNPDQRLAVTAISKCDAIWKIATNLWSLFNLPANREGFADLLQVSAV